MYQNLEYFNENHVFLRFNGLVDLYFERISKEKTGLDLENQIKEFLSYHEEFLFKASQVSNCVSKMKQILDLIKKQFQEVIETSRIEHDKNPECPVIQIPKNAMMLFGTTFTNEFLTSISPFLKDLITLQNRFLFILGIFMNIINLPDVFSKFFDEKDRPTPSLNRFKDKVKYLSRTYWIKHAKKLRRYRNIDEHRFNLLFNSGIDEDGSFHLYLPDDPDVDNITDCTFNEKIDAFPFFTDELNAFTKYVDDVLEFLKIPEKKFAPGLWMINLKELADFEIGSCISMVQFGGKLICLYRQDEEGHVTLNEIPLNIREMTIKI
ncbi:MAG TPA: hypothetical protein VKM55_30955 [Candidatus Lokiarchaeia archaeon]|nr:hypothetical protein [Candidatus Lokiarchaeia archaeon]